MRSFTMALIVKDYAHKELAEDDLQGIYDFIADAEIVAGPDELYTIVSELWPELLHKVKPPRSLMHLWSTAEKPLAKKPLSKDSLAELFEEQTELLFKSAGARRRAVQPEPNLSQSMQRVTLLLQSRAARTRRLARRQSRLAVARGCEMGPDHDVITAAR